MRWQPKFHELHICDCRRQYSLFFILFIFIDCAAFRIAGDDPRRRTHVAVTFAVQCTVRGRRARGGSRAARGERRRAPGTAYPPFCVLRLRASGPLVRVAILATYCTLGAQAASARSVRRQRGVRGAASSPAALWARSLWGTCTWASTCRPAAPRQGVPARRRWRRPAALVYARSPRTVALG